MTPTYDERTARTLAASRQRTDADADRSRARARRCGWCQCPMPDHDPRCLDAQ